MNADLKARVLEMLESVQWCDSINWGCTSACPSCRQPRHAEWCELAELIRELKSDD